MQITRPTLVRRDARRDVTHCYFADKARMEACVRGAIAWPMTQDRATNRVYGYALVCIQDVRTRAIYVTEETRFDCVDHIVSPGGVIIHEGLAPWLNAAWTHYFCETWYTHADPHAEAQWERTVWNSTMVDPAPTFVDAAWPNTADAELVLYRLGGQGMLQAAATGELAAALQTYQAGTTGSTPPPAPIHALMTAVTGYERWPWWDVDAKEPEDHYVPPIASRRDRWGYTTASDGGGNEI